jgi:predicted transcriptional regulator
MSIHPSYAQAIMAGTKTVEFRKRAFGKDVRCVVVYATAPVRRVLGHFLVDRLITAPPADLWRRYSKVGRIAADAYWAYYGDSAEGVAIRIAEVRPLSVPRSLRSLGYRGVAPQSYRYLARGILNQLS